MAQLAPSPASRRRASAASVSARRPVLALVARPEVGRSSVPFTVVCTIVLLAAIVGSLVLNIAMSNTSYEITRLQARSRDLKEQILTLEERQEVLGTPQELERRARDLGMVPGGNVAYIDLATGKIIGEAAAAEGAAPASLVPVVPAPESHMSIYDYGMGNERAN